MDPKKAFEGDSIFTPVKMSVSIFTLRLQLLYLSEGVNLYNQLFNNKKDVIIFYPNEGTLALSVSGRLASGDAVCGGVSDVMDDRDESTSFTGATPRDDSISSKSRRLSRLDVVDALC